MRRIITLAILIILSFLIQTTIISFHNVQGVSPNLMLILTMSFGVLRGRREGLLTGFFSGFLMDVFYNEILGPYMLVYMTIGYLNGHFHKNFKVENVLLPVILIMIDEFFHNFAVFILAFLLRNKTDLGYYFVHIFMPEAILTAIVTAVLYRVYVSINKYLKEKVKTKK